MAQSSIIPLKRCLPSLLKSKLPQNPLARTLHQLTRGPATIENNQRIQLVRHDSPKVASILVLNPSYDILVQPRCMSLASYSYRGQCAGKTKTSEGTVGRYGWRIQACWRPYAKHVSQNSTPACRYFVLVISFVLWPLLRMTLSNFPRFMAHPTHAFVLVGVAPG